MTPMRPPDFSCTIKKNVIGVMILRGKTIMKVNMKQKIQHRLGSGDSQF